MDEERTRIGPTLKRTREDLGLSFQDVENATNIRQRYLEAMEREDYSSMPGAVYAQGFLKTYANYLNLDGERLSQKLKSQWGVLRNQDESDDRDDRDDPPPRGSSGATTRPNRSRRRSRRRPFPVAALGGLILAMLVIVIGVGGLYSVGQRVMQASSGPGSAGTEAPANPEPASNASPENSNSPEESPENGGDQQNEGAREPRTTNNPGGVESTGGERAPEDEEPDAAAPTSPENLTMEVRVDGNISWLNIQTDGNVVFEQVAEPGFTQTFEAEEEITVWSGNAGAVFLEVNGQDYGPLGESGETKLQDFELKAAEAG